MTGSGPIPADIKALRAKRGDLADTVPQLVEALNDGVEVPYTQWEAWLALHHRRQLHIVRATTGAPRGPKYAPTDASRAAPSA